MILEFPLPTNLQLSKEDEEELISIKKEIRFKIKEDSKKDTLKKLAYFELKVSLAESLNSCCLKYRLVGLDRLRDQDSRYFEIVELCR
jgi:hypothetical protein